MKQLRHRELKRAAIHNLAINDKKATDEMSINRTSITCDDTSNRRDTSSYKHQTSHNSFKRSSTVAENYNKSANLSGKLNLTSQVSCSSAKLNKNAI